MPKRTREEQNVEPIAEENHYRAKKRRLVYGDAASATCVRVLFAKRSPPNPKIERIKAINNFRQEYNVRRLMELGKKGRELFQDD